MKILLKDPDKVEAVIEKIRGIHAISEVCGNFRKYAPELIKEHINHGAEVLLEVDFRWEGNKLVSYLTYCPISDIPTDEEYLNDNDNGE